MIVDRRDARPAPAGPDIARVEEERTGRLGLPLIVAGDLGDGDRVRPWAARFADLLHLAAAHETELAALEDDAAIAGREAARFGAIDDETCERKHAGERSAARFEIERAGQAQPTGVDRRRSEERRS